MTKEKFNEAVDIQRELQLIKQIIYTEDQPLFQLRGNVCNADIGKWITMSEANSRWFAKGVEERYRELITKFKEL